MESKLGKLQSRQLLIANITLGHNVLSHGPWDGTNRHTSRQSDQHQLHFMAPTLVLDTWPDLFTDYLTDS